MDFLLLCRSGKEAVVRPLQQWCGKGCHCGVSKPPETCVWEPACYGSTHRHAEVRGSGLLHRISQMRKAVSLVSRRQTEQACTEGIREAIDVVICAPLINLLSSKLLICFMSHTSAKYIFHSNCNIL